MIRIKYRLLIMVLVMILLQLPVQVILHAEDIEKTPSGIPVNELENRIDSFMQEQIGNTTPGLAIAVVKDGRVVLMKGYGYADLENKIPVDPQNTVFEFASISKLFVWTAAMQLVEQGKLKLEDDIKKYLPEEFTKNLKYKQEITMYDLMNHTAGFEQQPFDWLPISPEAGNVPLDKSLIEHQPKQVYTPKEVIAYSNYGAALAGYVVEKISGKDFYSYEMDEIFKPLGMTMTTGHPTYSDRPQVVDTKAKGYAKLPTTNFIPGIWSILWHYPAGSVNGTVEDLSKFLLALMPEAKSPLFKEQDTLSKMLSQTYAMEQTISSNSHGFWEYAGNAKGYWHPGNTACFSSFFAFVPEERFGFAVLTNEAYAIEPTYGLANLLMESAPKQEVSKNTMPSAKDIAGLYMYSMRSHTGIFEPASYLANIVIVEALDENTLSIKNAEQVSTYVQKSPNYYELENTDNSKMPFLHPQLYVEMSNGGVKRISGGHIMDILPLPKTRSIAFFWSSFMFAIVAALFFIIGLLLIIIKGAWRKIQPKVFSAELKLQSFFIIALFTLGTLVVLNNFYIVIKALEIIPLLTELKSNIIINWLLLLLFIVIIILKFAKFPDIESTQTQRVILILALIMLALTFFLLFNWHFFNFYGSFNLKSVF